MELINLIIKVSCIVTPFLIFVLLLQIHRLKELTIKNHSTVMATLQDFQNEAAKIEASTKTIAAYVQGSGMSAADQDAALKVVQDAVAGLQAAVPAAAEAPSGDGQQG